MIHLRNWANRMKKNKEKLKTLKIKAISEACPKTPDSGEGCLENERGLLQKVLNILNKVKATPKDNLK